LLGGVTPCEREHYQALPRGSRRARQYLASRWLLRAHLASELGLDPLVISLRFATDSPPVLPGTACRIGLSHSGELCLCIVAARLQVGCDVEYRRPRNHLRAIAGPYFHPAEAAYLNSVAADRACRDFYRLWSLKEATQKALGRGLSGGLRTPAFVLEPGLRCLDSPTAMAWTFASGLIADETGGYAMALAAGGAAPVAGFSVTRYEATAAGAVGCNCAMPWETVQTRPGGCYIKI
jgi:4'-phosphopantetheinyl transferase